MRTFALLSAVWAFSCFALVPRAPLMAANTIPIVASQWQATGGLEPDGTYHTYLVLNLPQGWHSYWRTPGDAGMAPQMDFAGSSNIDTSEARYPVPKREDDSGTITLVYTGTVVLPLRITPSNPAQAVDASLVFSYGLCEKICVPASANYSLHLDPHAKPDTANLARLAAAEALVPHDESPADHLKLSEATPTTDKSGKPAMSFTVTTTDAATAVDLFAEAPAEWALGQPMPEPAQGTLHRFTLSLDGVPPGADFAENPLTFTIASPLENIESLRILPKTAP